MSATIYKYELRARLTSVLTWALSIAAIILIFCALFPSFYPQAELMQEMMAGFPPELLMAFGMNGMNFASVLGFFTLAFLFAQLCLAIQAANYGFGLVSVEESELTADFLLTKPLTRRQIMTSKLLAALTSLLITDLVVWLSSVVFLNLFTSGHDYDMRTLLLLLLSVIPFQLVFLTVGMMISLLVKRVRSVTPYAMALAFGAYLLSVFSEMLGDAKLEKITPFKHFDPNYIVQNSAYDLPLVLISLIVTVVAVIASYWLYTRRDIPAVV